MTAPLAEAEDDAAKLVEEVLASARGQGFNSSVAARRAVELHAVKKAASHFKKAGYDVELRGKPFDLLCKRGSETLYVEVKGTQGDASEVILTPGEVKFARKNAKHMVLFVLHAIKVIERGGSVTASGGRVRLIQPWSINAGKLAPVTYWYTLPSS